MNWRVRLAISATVAVFILAAWELWSTAQRPRWAPGAHSPRAIRRLEKRCLQLFEEFCRTSPDFGIGTFTDPTGEVWLDADSEAAILEARRTSPDWISAVFSPARIARIREVEAWVKREMTAWIQSQPHAVFQPRDKQELLKRLRSTRLDFPSPTLGYPDEPELLIASQATYERLGGSATPIRRLRLGGAYVLGTSSRFNLVFTIAHELAHAIDPCELRSTGWAVPAFDRLGACFISQELAATPKDRVECRRDDQLAEAFSDWIAVKLAGQALRQWGSEYPAPQRWAAVGNSIRDLCEKEQDEAGSETHPHPRIRIERILGTDPLIREYLGCPASIDSACGLE